MVIVRNITPNIYLIKFSDGNRKTLRPFKSLVLSDSDYRLAKDYIARLERDRKVILEFKADEVIDTTRDVLAVVGSEALSISEVYRMSSIAFETSKSLSEIVKFINGKFMIKYKDTFISPDKRTFIFYKSGHSENAFLIPFGYGADHGVNGFYVASKFAILSFGYSVMEYSSAEFRVMVNGSLIYPIVIDKNSDYKDNLLIELGAGGVLNVFLSGYAKNPVIYFEVSDIL